MKVRTLVVFLALLMVCPALLGARRRNPNFVLVSFTATQTVTVSAPPLANPPPITAVASGSGFANLFSGGRFNLPAGLITGTLQTGPFTESGGQPVRSITIAGVGAGTVTTGPLPPAQNGAGVFQAGQGMSGGFGGAMRLLADALVEIRIGFAHARQTVNLSAIGTTSTVANTPSATIFLQTGTTSMQGFPLPASGTLVGRKWTTGMVTAMANTTWTTSSTAMGTGFDNRTANHRGTIQLVTPIVLRTSIIGERPGVATLTLVFGPQTASFAPLGGGLIGLGFLCLLPLWWERPTRKGSQRVSAD